MDPPSCPSSPEPGAILSPSPPPPVRHIHPPRSVDRYRPPSPPPLPTLVDRYVPQYRPDSYVPRQSADSYVPRHRPTPAAPPSRHHHVSRRPAAPPPTAFPSDVEYYSKPVSTKPAKPTLFVPPKPPSCPHFSSGWTVTHDPFLDPRSGFFSSSIDFSASFNSVGNRIIPTVKHLDPSALLVKGSDPRLNSTSNLPPFRPFVWPLFHTKITFDQNFKPPPPTSVVMAHLDRSWSETDLRSQLDMCGKIIHVRIAKDPASARSRESLGIARIKFATSDGSNECVSAFDGRRGKLPGEYLHVELDSFGTKYQTLVNRALETRQTSSFLPESTGLTHHTDPVPEKLKLPKRPTIPHTGIPQFPPQVKDRPVPSTMYNPPSTDRTTPPPGSGPTVVSAAIKTLRLACHMRIYRSLIDMESVWAQVRDKIDARIEYAMHAPRPTADRDPILDPWSTVVDQFPSFKKPGTARWDVDDPDWESGSSEGMTPPLRRARLALAQNGFKPRRWSGDDTDETASGTSSASDTDLGSSGLHDGDSDWSSTGQRSGYVSSTLTPSRKKAKLNGTAVPEDELMEVDDEYHPFVKPPSKSRKRSHRRRTIPHEPSKQRPAIRGIPARWDVLDYLPESVGKWRDKIVQPETDDPITLGLDWMENELVQLLEQASLMTESWPNHFEIRPWMDIAHVSQVRDVVRQQLMLISPENTAISIWAPPTDQSVQLPESLNDVLETICPTVSLPNVLGSVNGVDSQVSPTLGVPIVENRMKEDVEVRKFEPHRKLNDSHPHRANSPASDLPPTCARLHRYTKLTFDQKIKHRLPKYIDPLTPKERQVADSINTSSRPAGMASDGPLKSRAKRVKIARSSIHAWGMYALETIEPHEFIIEYVGEIVRQIVADQRERKYNEEGIEGASYLFRLDQDYVVDATKVGNYARFINHSCEPNSTAKIITVDGQKKIVIYAARLIMMGHEITYDYKFEYEEDKIVCLCQAKTCRGFLN